MKYGCCFFYFIVIYVNNHTHTHTHTVHSESIQTPFNCFNFMLQPDWQLFKYFFFSLIYTPYLIMTKWKQNFRNVCKFIKNKKTEISHLHKYSDPLLST